MRLVRFGARGAEKPGILDGDGRMRDLSSHVPDWRDQFIDPVALTELRSLDLSAFPEAPTDSRLGPPVSEVRKVIGVGPNFHESARLAGFKVNPEPTLFMKAATAVSGPNDPIEIPRLSTRTDWGVELAVVIGRTAKYVSVEAAMQHVAGFTLSNDLTERNFQLQRGGQWFKGKSHDTFAPLGPWLVTPDELPNYHELTLWLDVNGERVQSGETSRMIFKVPYLISYVSRFLRLEPGDVIMTGTPPGVGLSHDPPRFLAPNDRMVLGCDGLGQQSYVCIQG